MSEPKKHYHDHERIIAVALCQPAVRLVVVQAWHDDEAKQDHHAVIPVVVIRATVVSQFFASNYSYTPPPVDGTIRDLAEHGWQRRDSDMARTEPLILDGGLNRLSTVNEIHASNSEETTVACPWPPEQDEEKLAPVVAQLLADLRWHAERDTAPSSLAPPATPAPH